MRKRYGRLLAFVVLLSLAAACLLHFTHPKLPNALSPEDRSAILRLVRKELSYRHASVLPDFSQGSLRNLPRSAYRRLSGGIESVSLSTNYGEVFVRAADPKGLLVYGCRKETNGWAIVDTAEYVGD
jgi:hypothetical protein